MDALITSREEPHAVEICLFTGGTFLSDTRRNTVRVSDLLAKDMKWEVIIN
jgi:hypothetical protein